MAVTSNTIKNYYMMYRLRRGAKYSFCFIPLSKHIYFTELNYYVYNLVTRYIYTYKILFLKLMFSISGYLPKRIRSKKK